MPSTKITILKNGFSLLGAQLITWSATIVLTVLVPRYLGPALSGQLIIGTSIWAVINLGVEFGMNTAIVKEVARDPDSTSHLLGTTLILRLITFLIGCVLVASYTLLMGYSAETTLIVFCIGISQLLLILSSAYRSVLEGTETMEHIALAEILTKLTHMILAVSAVFLGYDLLAFVITGILAALVYMSILLFAVLRRFKIKLSISVPSAIALLRSGLPYLFSNISMGLYGIIDIWLLSYFLNTEAVGWYGAAGRLFGTLMFIPSIAMTVLFPVLSRMHNSDPDHVAHTIRRSFDVLLLISIPVGLGVFAVGSPVINILYGPQYVPSGPILSLMGVVAIFTYLNVLWGRYMYAIDRQKTWVIVMLMAALVKLPLGLWFIPWFQAFAGNGGLGGAFSNLITEGLMMFVGILLMPRGTFKLSHIITPSKIIISGVIMASAAWLLRDLFIVIPILAGAAIYTILVLLLRIIPKEDMELFDRARKSLLRRFQRVTANTA